MKELGVGVIGLGMGSSMLPINQVELSHMEVRGLCDISEERLSQFAKQYNIPFTTKDYKELLDRDDIDIIGVYSPDQLHAVHAIDSLLAGKHVICTKPMVTTMKDCEDLVKAVDETGKKFLVGQTHRFSPTIMSVKKMFDSGELGDLIYVESNYVGDLRALFSSKLWWRQKPQKDFLFGGGSHPVDLVRWFAGDIDEVHCYGIKGNFTPGYELEDNFILNLKFKSGKIGRVMAAYGIIRPPVGHPTLRIYASLGSVCDGKLVMDTPEGPKEQELTIIKDDFPGHVSEVIRYMKHFEDCIVNDKQPLVDVREGAKGIATCVAAWESVRTGKPVKVRNEF